MSWGPGAGRNCGEVRGAPLGQSRSREGAEGAEGEDITANL